MISTEKWSCVSAGLNGLRGEELLRSQEALTGVWVLWASSSERPLLCLLWSASPGTFSECLCEVVPTKAAVALELLQGVKGFHFCPCDVVWPSLAQPFCWHQDARKWTLPPFSYMLLWSQTWNQTQVAENNFCDSPNSIGFTGGDFAALFFLVKNAQHMC